MTLLLARWQFAVVTVFHFFFVPVTIGLGVLVAVMQTFAYIGKDEEWDRLSRFFGRLFLINLAVGVVTGIVLEFEFGLNWSSFSTYVGNIFGAPLAIEGLFAFFLESTFVGLWIFGRGRLSPGLHLATIWLTAAGSVLSALFILAANSWMQHPVGYRVVHGQAVLTSFWALFGNSTLWWAFIHTVLGAFVTAAGLLLGIGVWRAQREPPDGGHRREFLRAARLGGAVSLICVILVIGSGDAQVRVMDVQQPMKTASAEAIYTTTDGASFSLLTIGNLTNQQPVFQIRIPHLLSLMADLSWNGQVSGIDNVQRAEVAKYGPGSYIPVIWLTYWSFRIMVGAGFLIFFLGVWFLWLAWRRKIPDGLWFRRAALWGMALPFIANTAGWIFTEAGRQPWVVYGLLKTDQGVSAVTTADVAATLGGFVLVYTALGVVGMVLMIRAARQPIGETGEGAEETASPDLIY